MESHNISFMEGLDSNCVFCLNMFYYPDILTLFTSHVDCDPFKAHIKGQWIYKASILHPFLTEKQTPQVAKIICCIDLKYFYSQTK